MRPKDKRILLNYLFANAESRSQRRGDTKFANDDAFARPAYAVSRSAETVGTRSANRAAVLVGDNACETDHWRDVGGEA